MDKGAKFSPPTPCLIVATKTKTPGGVSRESLHGTSDAATVALVSAQASTQARL